NCTYAGWIDTGTVLLSRKLLFDFEAKDPAFKFDGIRLQGAGGSQFTSKGYYVLRSPETVSGNYLEVKLQTYAVTFAGLSEDAVLGGLQAYITVSSSGGSGEYGHVIYAGWGGYSMQASKHEFVIWSEGREGRVGSALLVSMPRMDEGHTGGADPCIAVGSESITWFNFVSAFQQLTRALHWEHSYATGFDSSLVDMGWRSQVSSDLWRNPTLMHRGLRGAPLVALNDAPLVESAYVLLSPDPNAAAESSDRIAGRLWDMIITTTAASGDEAMVGFDDRNWRRLSISQ